MCSPLHFGSAAVGAVIGVSSVYALNSKAVCDAAEKVQRGVQATWNALTFDNVATFTFTCVGLSIASKIATPAIQSIYRQIV